MNESIPDAKQERVNFVGGMFSEDENSVRFDLFPDRNQPLEDFETIVSPRRYAQ